MDMGRNMIIGINVYFNPFELVYRRHAIGFGYG